ncbi:MAG: 3-keto-5-aminohexanoate cleavage protein, partial [Candidatus Eremiobacteraeota bacterium]|nr:3-keto-5-aminohexanoate cleavage protein [Candidatus Eremiobacteraeota bacterium]
DHVFENPFGDIAFYLEAMQEVKTCPEMECFDCGHIHNAQPLIDMGLLKAPLCFSLVMGVLGGIPASTKNLLHMVESLPQGANWQVIGIGRCQWPLVAAAITMGGNVRVGLEDNFYLNEGHMANSNAELVEKAVRLVHELGGSVASPADTRQRLEMTRAPH